MTRLVPGHWILAHSDRRPVVGVRPLYEWGTEEPAALLKEGAAQAERLLLRGYDLRPARVGYYGDEERGVWLTADGALIEGRPAALAGRYG